MRVMFTLVAVLYLWWGTANCELVQGPGDRFPHARAYGVERVLFLPLLWPPAHPAFSWWLSFFQTPRLEVQRA